MDVIDHADEALSPAARTALSYRASVVQRQTLSREDSAAYRDALRVMRRVEGRERQWIARLLGISPSAVGKLLTRKVTTEVSA